MSPSLGILQQFFEEHLRDAELRWVFQQLELDNWLPGPSVAYTSLCAEAAGILVRRQQFDQTLLRSLSSLRLTPALLRALARDLGLSEWEAGDIEDPGFHPGTPQDLSPGPRGTPEISRDALLTQIIESLDFGWPVINLHGASGFGKSKVLFALRERLRVSPRYVDCLLPPLNAAVDDEVLFYWVRKRVGGGVSDRVGSAWEAIDNFARAGRRVVFLIDDIHNYEERFQKRLIDLGLQPELTRVVCTSLSVMHAARDQRGHRVRPVAIPALTVEESITYLETCLRDVSPAQHAMLEVLLAAESLRSPVALRSLYVELSVTPPERWHESFDRVHRFLDQVIGHQLGEVLLEAGLPERLLCELAAPRRLDVSTVVLLANCAGAPLSAAGAAALLDILFRGGFLKRFGGQYWWEGYYLGAIQRLGRPAPETWHALSMPPATGPDAVERCLDALYALEQRQHTRPLHRRQAIVVLEALTQHLDPDASPPPAPELVRALDLTVKAASEDILLLRVRSLECRGHFDEALQILSSRAYATAADAAATHRLRILDKCGRFETLRGEIDVEIARRELGLQPDATYGAALLYFLGRSRQASDSLNTALAAYELVEEVEDASTAYRAHARVERATIYIFAEEPELALGELEQAERLLRTDALLRQRADIHRYFARAHKLRAMGLGRVAQARQLLEAERHAKIVAEISGHLQYREGQIWATVLAARLAYLRGDLEGAETGLSSTARAVDTAGYHGAIPHVHRHWALVRAALGDRSGAVERLATARKVAESSGRRYVLALLADTEAKMALLLGDTDGAHECLLRAREAYSQVGLLEPPFGALKTRLDYALADPEHLRKGGMPW